MHGPQFDRSALTPTVRADLAPALYHEDAFREVIAEQERESLREPWEDLDGDYY